ncbi:MAG TPA: ABC transporter permease [Acidimicrobiales bacterium]|nr:ABC transporter permease [Acidimicrobiales bacterium]
MTAVVLPSRLHPRDLVQVGSAGLRTRRLRSVLSAAGIAIGIAAMVSVLGISESSRADLLSQLDRLGTNLLTVSPGQTMFGQDASLPEDAPAMVGRIGPVESVSSTESLDAKVYRSDRMPAAETGGIAVRAASLDLLGTLETGVARGVWLNAATERYPAVVLGAVAAERLGITQAGVQVWLGEQWFSVVGLLAPSPLAPEVDRSVLVGLPVAKERLGATGNPTTVYVRAAPDKVDAVAAVLPGTANPSASDEVNVNRPSDAIEARAAAKSAFTALFLGLGAVALLVGGVGIANVMVISVLERRSEIGLRRALGATRRHVAAQFLAESLLLSLLGGTAGVALGAVVTGAYAGARGWTVVVPVLGLAGGVVAALLIGAVAGVYPATRAARLSPTEALRTV